MARNTAVLTAMLRRWRLPLLGAALGMLAGLGYAMLAGPTYVAKAYVVVVPDDPSAQPSAASFAQAYGRMSAQGPVVAAAVRAGAGAATADELRTTVQAATSPDAPVVEVTGSAGTAAGASTRANLVANALVDTGNARERATRMRLVMLAPASAPDGPASPDPALSAAVGGAAGLLLGALGVASGFGRRRGPSRHPSGAPGPHGEPEPSLADLMNGSRR
jgi:capsular polysaccharide biosynthesis protein